MVVKFKYKSLIFRDLNKKRLKNTAINGDFLKTYEIVQSKPIQSVLCQRNWRLKSYLVLLLGLCMKTPITGDPLDGPVALLSDKVI